jgi:DNA helicase-2/ATP-dependent DNA helicase PcrA
MNKLIIAAAGSGKTTFLVNEALKITSDKVLITTFTDANEHEIRGRFFKLFGSVPENVTIQTWFSFLLQHGVKPYQDILIDDDIMGLLLVNNKSALKYTFKGRPVYFPESDVRHYYFSPSMKIYSDKIAKFAYVVNERTNGLIIDRIRRIFPHIFIDEVQDLAGYDLELVHLLLKTPSNVVMVGDPRQVTYHTHEEAKNNKYAEGQIEQFILDKCKDATVEIDKTSLKTTYRNCKCICSFANSIFSDYEPCCADEKCLTGHDGVFFVRPADVDEYLRRYSPVQLRDRVTVPVNSLYDVFNFGESKGLTFSRVLIYPTKPIIDWVKNNSSDLAFQSRSKFYVAVTRAEYSVAIVYDYTNKPCISGIQNYLIP